jgi:hypothetical protein
MADSAVYIELASNNGDFFTNALLDDVMIRPQYATQKVLIGTSNGNVPTVTITSNTLGILKTTPAYPLDVAGDINLTGTLRQNGAPYIGSQWSNNSSNVFLLTSNVGIGNSNPAFKLDVTGDINFTGILNQNGVPYIGSQWSNNSTNVFLLGSNVGIRTSNPTSALTVSDNSGAKINSVYIGNSTISGQGTWLQWNRDGGSGATTYATNKGGGSGGHIFGEGTNANGFTENMRLTSTGSLGVGTTSPSEKIDVNGNVKTSSNVYVMSRLGVGTSNPSVPVHVVGDMRVEGNLNVNGIYNTINTDVQVTDQFTVSNNGTGPALNVYQMGAQAIADFYDDSNLAVRIADGGFVGIGKSNPTFRLDVVGDVNFTGTLNQNGVPYIGSQWSNNSSNVFLLTSNVGIGVSNASYKLDVNGTTRIKGTGTNGASNMLLLETSGGASRIEFVDEFGANPTGVASYGTGNGLGLYALTNLRFFTSNLSSSNAVQRMIITQAGNVGISTTSPTESLQVNGKIYSTTQILGNSNDSLNAPSFSFREDSNTGLYHACNATLGFVAGGVEALRVTPGDVRVNQNLFCESNLNVGSNIIANGNLTMNNRLFIGKLTVNRKVGGDANVTKTSILGFSNASDGIILDLGSNTPQSNQALRITWSNSSELMRVTGIGNVGVGTTTPAYKLDVTGSINTTGMVLVTGGSNCVQVIGGNNPGDMIVKNYGSSDRYGLGQYTGGITRLFTSGSFPSSVRVSAASNDVRNGGALFTDYVTVLGGTTTNAGFVGIGTITPSEKLDVVGNIKASSNIYVTSRLGVNTSNPSQAVHVVGNMRLEGNLDVNGIFNTINTDVQLTDQFTVSNNGTGPALKVHQMGAQPVADFFDDSNLAMRIADGGNVGIGTSAPAFKFDVQGLARIGSNVGQGAGSPLLQLQNGTSNLAFFANLAQGNYNGCVATGDYAILAGVNSVNTGGLVIGNWGDSNAGIKIDKTGNVGVGTNSPLFKLDVNGDVHVPNNSALISGSTTGYLRLLSVSGACYIQSGTNSNNNSAAPLIIGTINNATEWARFDSSGNVGIGTTTPSFKLDVNGTSRMLVTGGASTTFVPAFTLRSDPSEAIFYWRNSNLGLDVSNPGNNLGSNKRHLIFNEYSDATSGFVGISTASPSYKLHVNGTIYATGDVICFSDKRLKSNITIIDSALSKLHKLNGYTFNLRNDDKTHTGLIAQELIEVLPEAVYKENKEDGEGYYSVAYGNMAGLFVEAIKELDNKYKKENEALREEIAQLRQLLETRTSP